MVAVSNADRIVFPAVKRTKGDVVAYYERIAERLLVHVAGRPLSIKRFPKGLAGPGFFQKNVPPHYPDSIARFAVPRSKAATKTHPATKRRSGKGRKAEPDVTQYPVVSEAEHLAYLANQGAIELHVPTRRADGSDAPDRIVIDLDPPEGELALVRKAALLTRDALAELGLASTPVATGSKGYHVVGALVPPTQDSPDAHAIFLATQKVAALLAHRHPETMTVMFRVAARGRRVFVDWLRNTPNATVVAPYSLRARPRATCAAPIGWDELDAVAPDGFSIDDVASLLERPDPLVSLPKHDAAAFVAAVDAAFDEAGLELEAFDRFRS